MDPAELAVLRDDADDLARRVVRPRDPEARYEGSDETGVVTVAIDDTGRVQQVSVARTWRGQVGVSGLDRAVRSAVEAATLARAHGLDTALGQRLAEPGPPPADPHRTGAREAAAALAGAMPAAPTSDQGRYALDQVLSMLETIDQSLTELTERAQAQLHREFTGRSTAGHVRVTVNGNGEIAGIDYDRRWLVEAHEYNINRETAEAFREAYQRSGERSVQALIEDGPLGELAALAGNPAEMVRRLGLRADG